MLNSSLLYFRTSLTKFTGESISPLIVMLDSGA